MARYGRLFGPRMGLPGTGRRRWKEASGRPLILASAFLLPASVCFPKLSRSQDSEGLFVKARAYQDKGEWSLADASYRQFLQQVPGSAAAHSNLGVVCAHERKFDEAIREYQAALKIDPSLSGVYLNLGILYFRESKYVAAAPVLREFLSRNPQNRQAQELLGLCDLQLDKYEDAVGMLAPLRADGSLDVLVALSASYIRLRRMSEAEAIVRELLTSQSNSAQVHFLMGQTYAGLNNFPQALQEFTAVAAFDRDWPDIELLIGATEARVGRYPAAEADLRAQLQVTPDSFEALYTLGALLNKEKRFEEAKALLLKAQGLNSKSGAAALQLAEACWKTGSRDAAWSAIRRAVQLDAENGQAHYLYAQIARERQDEPTARREFAIAQSLSARSAEEDILRLSEQSQRR